MSEQPTIFAIDFGTSNSLLCAAAPGRLFPPAPIDPEASDPTVMRSALYFASMQEYAFGVAAPRALVANGFRGRLIRSIKRHLPSRAFTATRIAEKTVTIEELIATLLGVMRERACEHYGADVKRAVLGRPARFSNDPDDDKLAETRLRKAAELAGYQDISFCPEPVAAAYDFASDLGEPKLVLVVDLGGGTSDFTLVRMGAHGFSQSDVLSVGGVAVAGDALDGALVRRSVAHDLGSTTQYKVPFGSNILTMPSDLIEMLCSPADLTLVDRTTVLRRLNDISTGAIDIKDRGKLDKLMVIVEDGVGFDLYEAVETAKRKLSEQDSVLVSLNYPGAELAREVTRTTLESSAETPIARILAALDETLAVGGTEHAEVDIVCLTGGTSRMPLIEQLVKQRLPNAAVRRLRSFHSVVQGLGRRAEELSRS